MEYRRGDKVLVGPVWDKTDKSKPLKHNVEFTVRRTMPSGFIEMFPRLDTNWHIFSANMVRPRGS